MKLGTEFSTTQPWFSTLETLQISKLGISIAPAAWHRNAEKGDALDRISFKVKTTNRF